MGTDVICRTQDAVRGELGLHNCAACQHAFCGRLYIYLFFLLKWWGSLGYLHTMQRNNVRGQEEGESFLYRGHINGRGADKIELFRSE